MNNKLRRKFQTPAKSNCFFQKQLKYQFEEQNNQNEYKVRGADAKHSQKRQKAQKERKTMIKNIKQEESLKGLRPNFIEQNNHNQNSQNNQQFCQFSDNSEQQKITQSCPSFGWFTSTNRISEYLNNLKIQQINYKQTQPNIQKLIKTAKQNRRNKINQIQYKENCTIKQKSSQLFQTNKRQKANVKYADVISISSSSQNQRLGQGKQQIIKKGFTTQSSKKIQQSKHGIFKIQQKIEDKNQNTQTIKNNQRFSKQILKQEYTDNHFDKSQRIRQKKKEKQSSKNYTAFIFSKRKSVYEQICQQVETKVFNLYRSFADDLVQANQSVKSNEWKKKKMEQLIAEQFRNSFCNAIKISLGETATKCQTTLSEVIKALGKQRTSKQP